MTPVDRLWCDRLPGLRWFQGKGLAIVGCNITALPWYVKTGDIWIRSELATIDLGVRQETYHLLVGYATPGLAEPASVSGQIELTGRGLVDVIDAPMSPLVMRVFLRVASAGDVAGLTWYEAPPDANGAVEAYTGEQSNSTVRLGDDRLLKLFRKLTPGRNREGVILHDLATSTITPRLVGTWATPDGSYDLGLFCERIQQAQDGFTYARQACADSQPIDDAMVGLGQTLCQLHANLAEIYGAATRNAADLSQAMLTRLDRACTELPELAARRAGLQQALSLPSQPVTVQWVHGDFHLGQALISPHGWTIIDFEGEPLKSAAERAAPDAVWRDVAGGLRSLDYARHSANAGAEPGQAWYRQARSSFLTGYLGPGVTPPALLTAYEVDKAIYELLYETRNRPSWARIPRQAIDTALTND